MGSAAGKTAENTVNEAASESSTDHLTLAASSSPSSQEKGAMPPSIIVTAPSREDLLSQNTGLSIAEANKERRPGSTPIVVGGRFITGKA